MPRISTRPLPPLWLLDQAPLSQLVKEPGYEVRLRPALGAEGAALGIDLGHVVETAIWQDSRRDRLIEIVESFPHVLLRPAESIMLDEVRTAYNSHLGVGGLKAPEIEGDLFSDPECRGFGFRHLVPWTRLNTRGGKDLVLDRLHLQDVVIPAVHEKRKRLGVGAQGKSSIEFEISCIRQVLFESFRLGKVGVTPGKVEVKHVPTFRDFADKVPLNLMPYFCAYVVFNGYEYSNPGRKDTKGDLSDAEHALHAIWAAKEFVTENHVAQVLRSLFRNAEFIGFPDGHLRIRTLTELRGDLGLAPSA